MLGFVQGLRVSQLARRAGVAPSTVRSYERAGVLPRARRAENGYRVFDDSAVDRLRLVARAKNIGMSLEDIASLAAEWTDGDCRSIQAHIRQFLTERIGRLREQRVELDRFDNRLRASLCRLPADPGPASCTAGCGCDAALDAGPPADSAPAQQTGAGRSACTLDDGSLDSRLDDWRALAAQATSVERRGSTVRLDLPANPEMTAVAASLSAAGTACCTQTRFLLEITAGRVTLTAEVPGTLDLLHQ